MHVVPGNKVTAVCCEQLSKIIKHLQAQLEHQEAVGAGMEGQLATALAELNRLQAFEANQQEIIEQVLKLYKPAKNACVTPDVLASCTALVL